VSAATFSTHPEAIHPLAIVTVEEYMSSVQAEETQTAASTTSAQISMITLPSTPPASIDASVGTFFQNMFANTTHFF
jgi:hypothetical protein